MKLPISLCMTLLLVACYTPAELRTEGKKYQLLSKQQPPKVAECIASNMEDFPGSALVARVRNTTPIEISVRGNDSAGYAMIEVADANPGSQITFFVLRGVDQQRIDRFTNGCL